MYCRICGKQIPDNSAFCSNCGTAQAGSSASAATPTSAAPTPAAPMSAADSIPTPAVPASPAPAPAASAPPEPPSWYTPQPFAEFGAAAPAVKPATRKKNTSALIFAAIAVLLAAALVLSFLGILPSPFGSTAAFSGFTSAPKSFATPEDAIESFVGYLKAGDYDGALSACAINSMASGFDYKKYAERLSVVPPITMAGMPSEYAQYVKYNALKNTLTVMNQMIGFTVSFSLSEGNSGIINGMTTMLEDGQFPDGLIEELNPDILESLEIVDIAKTSLHDTPTNRENQKKQAETCGADDIQFRSVLYKYMGSYYVGGFTLIEYNGRWQVQNMSDPIAGISAFGTPIPVSDTSEFQSLLGY